MQYIYVNKAVRVCVYFSKLEGFHQQNTLGKHDLEYYRSDPSNDVMMIIDLLNTFVVFLYYYLRLSS